MRLSAFPIVKVKALAPFPLLRLSSACLLTCPTRPDPIYLELIDHLHRFLFGSVLVPDSQAEARKRGGGEVEQKLWNNRKYVW